MVLPVCRAGRRARRCTRACGRPACTAATRSAASVGCTFARGAPPPRSGFG